MGVAFALIFPAVSALGDPFAWIGYMPIYILDILPVQEITVLNIFGAIQVVIAAWILFGKDIRIPALSATILLLAIVALNWGQMDVLFRDVSIAVMSLALFLTAKKE
jgi:hypothetical protein